MNSTTAQTTLEASASRRRSRLVDFFSRLWRKRLGALGGAIVLALLAAGIFAPILATHDIHAISVKEWYQSPSLNHWLGTDHLGRDIFSRIIYGAQVSMIVGMAAAAIHVVVAVIIGVTSGFLGGKLDLVVQRFVDAWFAFPYLIILLTVMSIVGRGVPQLIIVLGVSYGIVNSRVIRSAVIAIKENDYFQAAFALGSPTSRTLWRHVIPNIMPPIIIIFTVSIGGVILAEASLSFLGFGLPLGTPSWGAMLSWEGRRYMEEAPMLAIWPGLCLTVVVYGINMFGDALRDLLDPRLRGSDSPG